MKRSSSRFVVVAVVAVVSSGCWPDWGRLFDTTVSTDERVEDLRVLAITADPPAFLADADGNFGDVVVDPFVVDPRGGSVHVIARLCRRNPLLPRCDGPSLTLFDRELEADVDVSLGVVAGDDVVVSLGADDLATLELGPLSSVPQSLDVVVDVSRPGSSPPERESASLTLPIRYDPRAIIVVNDGDRARVCGVDEEDALCTTGLVDGCGDGVIDEFESCDPPDEEGGCDAQCQRFDRQCFEQYPACIVVEEPNQRPRITGFRTDVADRFTVATDGQDVDRDGVIDVDKGGRVDLQPVVDEVGAFDVVQTFFSSGFFGGGPIGGPPVDGGEGEADDDGCDDGPTAGCASDEIVNVRFYIRDGPLTLVQNEGGFFGGETAATLDVGSASGDEPVVVVVADSAGGFDVATVTLHIE